MALGKEIFALRTLRDLPNLSGRRVVLRLDLNVPFENGKVADSFRIEKALPTLELLHNIGAKTAIISHIESRETDSLEAVTVAFPPEVPVRFAGDALALSAKRRLTDLSPGGLLLFENLRLYAGEAAGSRRFAESLSELGEFYVNDAFSVSHRPHASIVGLPRFLPSAAGTLFEKEIQELSRSFHPPTASLFIFAGGKPATKIPLAEKFLDRAGKIFVGGVLANDFFKAKGLEIGRSACSSGGLSKRLLESPKIILPVDVVVETENGRAVRRSSEVGRNEEIVDAGPQTLKLLEEEVRRTLYILWNGPLGSYEDGDSAGSEKLASVLAYGGAETVVGGGDTVAIISRLGLLPRFKFVSTGGGAMLEFLAKGTLPGIEALKRNFHLS